ncbi:hypothetical protein GTU75_06670 [Erysipelothrix rhusiopathiae]|uniref:hypothetical protein n=1 Tax=Erysipelothrix sp. strain 2 (EsS2-7-Brazil) TaxID=2500579 RepID=UPI00137856D9|nr:hypothetical protein [Erysipelothrix sp. strain 2 (EsS2-7-Brazil)]MBK2404678.1 hypothetical protein [Erysipelothrix sp. strain 2 (EsS2-7-Brazil)]NBA01798.1 hypothetical protein [Erysipelothrix rhusiopathiae]
MRKIGVILGCMVLIVMQFTPLFATYESVNLDEIDAPGTYLVRLQFHDHEGRSYWKRVQMTITADDLKTMDLKTLQSEPITSKTERIEAFDLKIPAGSLERLTDLRLIELAKAHAWILETQLEVPITSVIKEYGDGSDTVLFKTALGTQKRVQVFPKSLSNPTWTPSHPSHTSGRYDEGFQSIMFTHIKTTLLILLLLPIIVISFMYLYTKKQLKEVDVILYKKDQNTF